MDNTEKVIGILGGMGPEATLDCFASIIRNTPAQKDQDHLRVLIESNPKIEDRTAAILGKGPSPLPAMIESARALERAGADFLIMPCVSAHFFVEDLLQNISLPFLSIFESVNIGIQQNHPRMNRVGLLATTGTIQGGLFQQNLSLIGIEILVGSTEQQERVMKAIYDIKNSDSPRQRESIKADLLDSALNLVKLGAQGIIAGCTEIPLALEQKDLPPPYFDVLDMLAREAIRRAGREPVHRATRN
ncbi:MAG: amino acid racemase [Desulfohalobiaceae bacterium]|nr:amino acid racemase [Desulfohalobiaceae bacterium]